jgi:hypothetical protein
MVDHLGFEGVVAFYGSSQLNSGNPARAAMNR